MAKKILDNIVIGNALISTKKEKITKKELYLYWNIVDMLLPEDYYTCGDNNSFEVFCEEYGFLVRRIADTMIVNCSIERLERYCRLGISKKVVKIFDVAGKILDKIANEIDCENLDASDLRQYIDEEELYTDVFQDDLNALAYKKNKK